MYVVVSFLIFVFFVFSLIDVIRSPSAKHLPKFAWVVVVILIPLLGSLLWWAVGREYERAGGDSPAFPERVVERTRPRAVPRRPEARTTEQQLADLEREEREERLRAELARRRRERGLDDA